MCHNIFEIENIINIIKYHEIWFAWGVAFVS